MTKRRRRPSSGSRRSSARTRCPTPRGDPSLFGFGYSQLAIIDGSNAAGAGVAGARAGRAVDDALAVAADVGAARHRRRRLLARGRRQGVPAGDQERHGHGAEPARDPVGGSWPALAAAQTLPSPPTGTILDAAAGDFLGQGQGSARGHHVHAHRRSTRRPRRSRARGPNPPTSPSPRRRRASRRASSSPGPATTRRCATAAPVHPRRQRQGSSTTDGVGHGPRGKDELVPAAQRRQARASTAGTRARGRTSAPAATRCRARSRRATFCAAGVTASRSSPPARPSRSSSTRRRWPTTGNLTLLTTSNITDRVPTAITDVTADRLFGYTDKAIASWQPTPPTAAAASRRPAATSRSRSSSARRSTGAAATR